MKILNVNQIREMDAATIQNEPISSYNLMERASLAFVKWYEERFDTKKSISVFCGKGNNGGDGLAISRILTGKGYHVRVFIIEYSKDASKDFQQNLEKVETLIQIKSIFEPNAMPDFVDDHIVIDALLGSGLSRPVNGLLEEVIKIQLKCGLDPQEQMFRLLKT